MPLLTTLRWLHFTDLHVGQPDAGLWPSAKHALLDDLRRTTHTLGPWDVVMFTGDLAFSGTKGQYAKLDAELKQIWQLFDEVHPRAVPPILLAVPGNHDLARPDAADPVAEQLLGPKSSGREALWSGKRKHLNAVKKWFHEYTAWWERCSLRPQTDLMAGLLPGEYAYTLKKDGVSFGFLGMNSSFLQMFGYVDAGQLWMDPRQIGKACGGDPLAWARRHQFAFLLTHHPPSWLTPDAKRRYNEAIAPPGAFTAHLCGHLHESLAQQTRAGRGVAREIWQGPSLFGLEKAKDDTIDRKHGYTAGRLEVSRDGAHTLLWPRLGVRRQDGSWALTADVSYQLDEDLLATPAEPAPGRRSSAALKGTASGEVPAPATPLSKAWRTAVEESPLWPTASDVAAHVQARDMAARIADLCWQQWQDAQDELPGDPWRDSELPVRILDRLAAFVPREKLSPQETTLLLLAPFVREALFAAGARWMVPAHPLDLRYESNHPARKALEPTHSARPALIRHMEKLERPARDAVGFWLMGRALLQCPHLWEDSPKIPPAAEVVTAIGRIAKDGGAHGWMLTERLVQLARHVGVSPDIFHGDESIDREPVIELGGLRIRLAALARMLSAAGAWALDVRFADELVADHCGRESFEPDMVCKAVQNARWEWNGDVHRLTHTCEHPVVDFVLRNDLVERAEHVIRRFAQDRDTSPGIFEDLCDGLPTQLRADITIGKGSNRRPLYRVPHVRFRLDHNQIRELLMGEQLYGSPHLAVRELYQNALDACRHRRARVDYLAQRGEWYGDPYDGKISFRQGKDEKGREYIECEDNGVGMNTGILEDVFAVAGKRFKDTPEYIEECARWAACRNPPKLWPNSKFGIGVLSYFMLADEIEVWTRRFGPRNKLGTALLVQISSASGLFRLEEVGDDAVPHGGTRVRVYLRYSMFPPGMPILCRQILANFLWIAEFTTTVHEAGAETLRWTAGVLMPNGQPADPADFRVTTDPDVWWTSRGQEPLLADGIVVANSNFSHALVNLRAEHFQAAKLSANRMSVMNWEQEWVRNVLRESVAMLVGWEGLTVTMLHSVLQGDAVLGPLLRERLTQNDVELPLVAKRERADGKEGCRLKFNKVGYILEDKMWVLDFGEKTPNDLFFAWRTSTWQRTGALPKKLDWTERAHLINMPSLVAAPGDVAILSCGRRQGNYDEGPFAGLDHLVIGARDVLRTALGQQRPVREIVNRVRLYEFLGFELAFAEADVDALEKLRRPDDVGFFLAVLREPDRLAEIDVPLVTFALLGLDASRRILDLRANLTLMGVHVSDPDSNILDIVKLVSGDVHVLHSLDYMIFRANQGWRLGEVPAVYVLERARAHRISSRSVMDDLRKLEPLGISAPNVDSDRLDRLSDADLRLLSNELERHGATSWVERQVPVAHIAAIAERLGISLGAARSRLDNMSWMGIELPRVNAQALDEIGGAEPNWRYMAQCFTTCDAMPSQVAAAAQSALARLRSSVDLADRLGILSEQLRAAFDAIELADAPCSHDALILQAFERAPGESPELRRRRGRATARFFAWELSDDDLDAAIERLLPLIDVIVNNPDVSV